LVRRPHVTLSGGKGTEIHVETHGVTTNLIYRNNSNNYMKKHRHFTSDPRQFGPKR